MTDTMRITTDESLEELRQQRKRGEVDITISRQVARQFYIVTALDDIRGRTGRNELAAKLAVYAGTGLTPVVGAIGLVLIVYLHGWWAAFLIPIAGILWTVIAGFLNPVGPMWTISAATLATLALYAFATGERAMTAPAVFWMLSLWIDRATYVAAGFFLERLVMRSHTAFEMLCDHIEIRRNDESE